MNIIILDHSRGMYGVEIPERTWHMLVVLEENSVIYEVKDGPWSPLNDKQFASWAPGESDPAYQTYLTSILKVVRAEDS